MKYTILPGIGLMIDSEQPGKKVWILALTHGNEPAGLYAQELFLNAYSNKITSGQVYLIQVNPKAYQSAVRFIDVNMNRIGKFPQDLSRSEDQRLLELMAILNKLDVALDIHSVPTEIHQTIGIADLKHLDFAREVLKTDILLVDENFDRAGSVVSFVNRNGGIGLGVECGSHADDFASQNALQSILRLLVKMDMLDLNLDEQDKKTEVFRFFEEIFPETLNFHYLQSYQNFSELQPWEIFAQDWEKIYKNQTLAPKYLGIIMDKVILWDGMGFLFEKLS